MMISAEDVGAIMALTPPIRSFAALDAAIREGLPMSALRKGAAKIGRSDAERRALVSRIVPTAASGPRRRLTPEESGQTERLARTFATTALVWCNEEDAREFFYTPHPLLQGCRPVDLAMSELGARRVEHLLFRLLHGLPA
ncbi:DUF2384 domain-containing protein [Cupriavidus respiraculi]|uniref:antitoxin Xre/MbcA/ParS toxin-binding domain-containing protein n=1 Tax=Cupriavidus respiraculi TaxID=195930 RepID=UPI001C96C92E|nr:antitoxin Xre/MbcA/ParS toxin-binding domain-containing protein [Cupriavidus respiraculi]MBY4947261.1 DUF2384 domain-containing protein [Cupriavidus respiraculi]